MKKQNFNSILITLNLTLLFPAAFIFQLLFYNNKKKFFLSSILFLLIGIPALLFMPVHLSSFPGMIPYIVRLIMVNALCAAGTLLVLKKTDYFSGLKQSKKKGLIVFIGTLILTFSVQRVLSLYIFPSIIDDYNKTLFKDEYQLYETKELGPLFFEGFSNNEKEKLLQVLKEYTMIFQPIGPSETSFIVYYKIIKKETLIDIQFLLSREVQWEIGYFFFTRPVLLRLKNSLEDAFNLTDITISKSKAEWNGIYYSEVLLE